MTPPPRQAPARPRLAALALWLSCLALLPPLAKADYPDRPVTVVVPFPSGAAADSVARVIARQLSLAWGQQVLVENRPGAAGMKAGASSPPDGYTLLLGAGSGIVTGPLVNRALPYRPADLAPVARLVTNPTVLTVTPALPVRTLDELVALARARPRELNYSSSGVGAPNHLGMELFQMMAAVSMTHIPYSGAAPALKDLVSGEVQVGLTTVPSALLLVKAGKLRPLAVVAAHRSPVLPDVPTLAEAGLPGLVIDSWYGLFAPAGTPPALVGRISAEVRKALADPALSEALSRQGAEPAPLAPQEFARFIQVDTAHWSRVIRERRIKVEE